MDKARGLAIFLVVIGHVLYFSIYNEKNYEGWQLFDIISFFHMPLFFFIAGVVMQYNDMPWNALLKKLLARCLRLMIPFLLLGSIYTYTIGCHSIFGFFSSAMKEGYWFLWVLTIFTIFNSILVVCRKIVANMWGDLLFGLLMTMILNIVYRCCGEDFINYVSLYQIKTYYPYFFIAAWLNHYGLIDILFRNAYFQFVVLFGTPLGLYAHISGVEHLGIASKILCVMSVMVLMYMLESSNNKILNKCEEWGRNTLSIYTLHYFILPLFFVPYIGNWLIHHYSLGVEFLISTLIAVLVMEVTSKIGFLFKRNTIINNFM